jgi:hypothetical protein
VKVPDIKDGLLIFVGCDQCAGRGSWALLSVCGLTVARILKKDRATRVAETFTPTVIERSIIFLLEFL